MRRTTRICSAMVAVGMAATVASAGGHRAQAAGEGANATWLYKSGPQAPVNLSCGVGSGSRTYWRCSTPTLALTADSGTCIQTVYINVLGLNVGVPLFGCSAELAIPPGGWPGTAVCVNSSSLGRTCHGAMAAGFGYFSYQPVVGSPFYQVPATITHGVCSATGGQAIVTAQGISGTTAFSMSGQISWIGSCSFVGTLTWSGSLVEV